MRICEKTTCTENTFWSTAVEVGLFSNVVFVYEHFFSFFHEIFPQVRRSKSDFLKWMWEGRNFFSKTCFWHCSLNVYLFSNMVFRHTQNFNQKFVWFREMKISFSQWFCEESTFSQSSFVFRLPRRTFFFFRRGSEIDELSSFIVSWVRRCKTIVFVFNLRTIDLLRNMFHSLQCATNAHLFSNVVCRLTQTFTLNVETKSEKY